MQTSQRQGDISCQFNQQKQIDSHCHSFVFAICQLELPHFHLSDFWFTMSHALHECVRTRCGKIAFRHRYIL